MTTKEQVIEKINSLQEEELVLKEILELIEARESKKTCKERAVIRFEDITPADWPFPPESEWQELWEEKEKK